MGERLQSTFNIIWDSIKQIFTFWPKIVFSAILYTILVVASAIGLEFMFNFSAYLIAIVRGENAVIGDFYHPYYFWGVACISTPIFMFLILHGAAQEYKVKKIEAAKHTWDGVKFSKKEYRYKGELKGYGIEVKNQKPYNFTFQAELPYLELDGLANEYVDNSNTLKGRKLTWDENYKRVQMCALGKDKRGVLDVFRINDDGSGEIMFFMPREDNRNHFDIQRITFKETARGEIEFIGNYDGSGGIDLIQERLPYSFEIDSSRDKTFTIKKGRLQYRCK